MRNLHQEIRRFVVDNFLFGQEDDNLQDETSFMDNGIIDSTGVLELMTFVEEQYDIKIEDEELIPENLDSIQNLASFVTAKLGET